MPQNLSPTSIADTPLKKERPKTHKRRANDDRRRHSPTSHYTPDTPTPLLLKDNMNFSVDEYESVGERGAYRNAVLAQEAQRDQISSPRVITVIPTSCYDHALLVTGYDVLLSTLQGNLSFSTSSASSFASTHAGPDHFHLIDLRLRHHALSDSCLEPPSRVLPHGQLRSFDISTPLPPRRHYDV